MFYSISTLQVGLGLFAAFTSRGLMARPFFLGAWS